MTTSNCATRRARLAQRLRSDGIDIAIVPTAPERRRNADSDHPYRHDSHFHYLTGFDEPQAWLVLRSDGHCTLFCRPIQPEREAWDGQRLGIDAAPGVLGVDSAWPIEALGEQLPRMLANQRAVGFPFGRYPELQTQVEGWLASVRARDRIGVECPTRLHDLHPLIAEMRLLKDAEELATMRRAAAISAGAHRRVMRYCAQRFREGATSVREYEIEAELLHEFRRHGAQSPAYPSIVAAGANACVLHHPAGSAALQPGELCLVDAGCELDGYASDVTRTFPASGRFSAPQRELYEVVLAAQQAAIDATRPGRRQRDAHHVAVRVLAQGLLGLGLLSRDAHGDVDDVIASAAYRPFYMHGTGHWLGRDVHDVGEYLSLDEAPTARAVRRHGGDAGARPVRAAGRRRAGALLEPRHPHRGRRCGHQRRQRLRADQPRRAGRSGRDRGVDAGVTPTEHLVARHYDAVRAPTVRESPTVNPTVQPRHDAVPLIERRLRLAVVGAGPVGLSLAVQAARALPRAQISLYDTRAIDADVSADPRTLAMSLGSVQLLQRLGAWRDGMAQPITEVHVSQQAPSFGGLLGRWIGDPQVRIRATEMGVPQLGAVLSYGTVTAALQQVWLRAGAAEPQRLCSRFATPVRSLKPLEPTGDDPDAAAVEVDADIAEAFDLAVIAEGGVFAEQARKPITRDYGQVAWVGRVTLAGGRDGVAYERFTRHGPAALLPLAAGQAALVWCVDGSDDPVAELNDAQRCCVLNTIFPAEVGRITSVSPLKRFPLGLNAERTLTGGALPDGQRTPRRIVRIGNAAQTLHPVAGQGLNLGLRDAHVLVRELARAGDVDQALRRLDRQRAPDRWSTIAATDFLARSFTWQWPGASSARGLGLAALQAWSPLRSVLTRQMMYGRR
jgi:ubiquinone biosynthesis UbiH/UbiF/VisC/COQ6 family hydroxylase